MILNLKRSGVAVALASALIVAGAQALRTQRYSFRSTVQAVLGPLDSQLQAAGHAPQPLYETRAIHDPDGTGKFYMGREIAQVMGFGGIEWLDRPERQNEERPTTVIDALGLRGGEVVAGLGRRVWLFFVPYRAKGRQRGQGVGCRCPGRNARDDPHAHGCTERYEYGSSESQRDRSPPAREQRGHRTHGGRLSRTILSV